MLIATDYTCIPFMEETDCDYYVVPSDDLIDRFSAYGIPAERMLPYGIPVIRAANSARASRKDRHARR